MTVLRILCYPARDFAARLAGAHVLPAAADSGSKVKVRPGLASFVLDRLALEETPDSEKVVMG